jgi:hypothetical protein
MLELKDIVGETATESELREKSTSVDAGSMFNHAIFGAGSNTTILIGQQSSITATQSISGTEFADAVRQFIEHIEGFYQDRVYLAPCRIIPRPRWQSCAKRLLLPRLTLAACAVVWNL